MRFRSSPRHFQARPCPDGAGEPLASSGGSVGPVSSAIADGPMGANGESGEYGAIGVNEAAPMLLGGTEAGVSVPDTVTGAVIGAAIGTGASVISLSWAGPRVSPVTMGAIMGTKAAAGALLVS
jgi:hypothetical protein